MGKLHELLAVEGDLEGTWKKVMEEAKTTFAKKPGFFQGFHKQLEMFDEDDPLHNSVQDHQELTTTVHDKLSYIGEHGERYFDVLLQKESTNQTAVADLIVDGTKIVEGVPATFLLGMETRLKNLRTVYESMPTLPPGKNWEEDSIRGEGVYKLDSKEVTYKTKKTFQHKTLYDATKEHPAQIEKWEETENVGKYFTEHWTGMVSSAEKSIIIGRLDKLIQAVKKARQRANSVDVVKRKVGKELFNFIHGK